MKITIEDVQVGEFFVKQYLVREIVIDEYVDVKYRTYFLDDGKPSPPSLSQCSKRWITKWAERKATPEEIARMQRKQAIKQGNERALTLTLEILRLAPDELLLDEVRHRGYSIEKKHNPQSPIPNL